MKDSLKEEIKAMLKYVNRKSYNLFVVKEMIKQLHIEIDRRIATECKEEINEND